MLLSRQRQRLRILVAILGNRKLLQSQYAFVSQIQRYPGLETVSQKPRRNSFVFLAPFFQKIRSLFEFRNQPKADLQFFVAFILYRQHNHAAVAAQNPGLSNPEISKIIGQQWKSEPVSVKDEWKQLAEVFKALE